MNKSRRATITKAEVLITEARAFLEAVRDEEQDAYDAMPESFQNGERGEASTVCLDALNEIIESVETAEGGCPEARGEG